MFWKKAQRAFVAVNTNNAPFVEKLLDADDMRRDVFCYRYGLLQWPLMMVVALTNGRYITGFLAGLLLSVLVHFNYRYFAGTRLHRLLTSILLLAYGMTFVQISPGYVEPHFQIYSSLFVLASYLDYAVLSFYFLEVSAYYIGGMWLQMHHVPVLGKPFLLLTWGSWDAVQTHLTILAVCSIVFFRNVRENTKIFMASAKSIQELQDLNDGLDSQSRAVERQLSANINHVHSVLSEIESGTFLIGRSGIISDKYYFPLAEEIIGIRNLAGKPISALLADFDFDDDTRDQMNTVLFHAVGNSALAFDVNEHLLPRNAVSKTTGKSFAMGWTVLANDKGVVEHILLTVEDISAFYAFKGQDPEITFINEICDLSRDKLKEVLHATIERFAVIRQAVDKGSFDGAILNEVYREAHTIKGTARCYSLAGLALAFHGLERNLDSMRASGKTTLTVTTQLHHDMENCQKVIQTYIDGAKKYRDTEVAGAAHTISVPSSELKKLKAQVGTIDEQDIAKVYEIADFIRGWSYRPYEVIEPDLSEMVNNTAEMLEKPEPYLVSETNGVDIMVAWDKVDFFKSMFVHLIRNALDHGIENESERRGKGKDPHGAINIEFIHDPGKDFLDILFSDDGAGLNINAVLEKALTNGLLTAESNPSVEEIADLIFHPGLTTKEIASEISGKGVGMDALRKSLKREGGHAEIVHLSERDDGFYSFKLKMRMPANFFRIIDQRRQARASS